MAQTTWDVIEAELTRLLDDESMRLQSGESEAERTRAREVSYDKLMRVAEIVHAKVFPVAVREEWNIASDYVLRLGNQTITYVLAMADLHPNNEVTKQALSERVKLALRCIVMARKLKIMLEVNFGAAAIQAKLKDLLDESFSFITMVVQNVQSLCGMAQGLAGGSFNVVPEYLRSQIAKPGAPDGDKPSSLQLLTDALVKHMIQEGLARYADHVCKQILAKGEDGKVFFSHAWEELMTIEEYVNDKTEMETNHALYLARIEHGNYDKVVKFLREATIRSVPLLKPQRYRMSFLNGVYFVDEERFYPYTHARMAEEFVSCKFFPHDFDAGPLPYNRRQPNLLLARMENNLDRGQIDDPGDQRFLRAMIDKYPRGQLSDPTYLERAVTQQEIADRQAISGILDKYDLDASDLHPSAFHISTPHLTSILRYQELDEATQLWIWVMIGRMLYNMGDKDQWQVALFLYGIGGTGKSTLIKIISEFYKDTDIAVLANNAQADFGLETIYDCWMWTCPEVKANFSIDQATIQSLVAGDKISINRKHQKALQMVHVKAHGILAGNERGPWVDLSGCMARRLLFVVFAKKVTQVNTEMMNHLRTEMPLIIRKANILYLDMVQRLGPQGIWDNICPYFLNTRSSFQAAMNPVVGFLTSKNRIHLQQGVWMAYSEFLLEFENYRTNSMTGRDTRVKTPDLTLPFSEYGIFVDDVTPRRVGPNEAPIIATFLIGVCRTGDQEWQLAPDQASQPPHPSPPPPPPPSSSSSLHRPSAGGSGRRSQPEPDLSSRFSGQGSSGSTPRRDRSTQAAAATTDQARPTLTASRRVGRPISLGP